MTFRDRDSGLKIGHQPEPYVRPAISQPWHLDPIEVLKDIHGRAVIAAIILAPKSHQIMCIPADTSSSVLQKSSELEPSPQDPVQPWRLCGPYPFPPLHRSLSRLSTIAAGQPIGIHECLASPQEMREYAVQCRVRPKCVRPGPRAVNRDVLSTATLQTQPR